MLQCPKCGQGLDENANFCFACGAKIIHGDKEVTCPNCGATVVDGLFCSGCGANLSPHTEETHVPQTHLEDGVDALLAKAKTLLTLEQYARACDVYEKIIDSHPDDYRGWWGLLVSCTHNLTVAPVTDEINLALTMKNVKKLAPPEEYAKCEKEFIAYLMRVDTLELTFEDETLAVNYAEAQLKRADALLSQKSFYKACEMYDRVIENCPDHYYAWWGKLLAVTENLTQEEPEDFDCVEVMEKIKSLASPEEYASFEKDFVSFLKKTVSRPYAQSERADLERKLAVLKKARIPFLDGKKAYESIEEKEKAEFASAQKARTASISSLKDKLAGYEKMHAECEETIEKKGTRRKFGIFFIIVGILLSIFGIADESAVMIVIGVVCALIIGGILMGTSNANDDHATNQRAKTEITHYRDSISKEVQKNEQATTAFYEASKTRTDAVALLTEKVQEIDAVIKKIVAFQAVSEEEFTLYWLDSDCDTYKVECSEACDEECETIIDDVYDALYQKTFPVLLRCNKCGNQTIVYVDILGKFNRFGQETCSFCEETIYLSSFLNDDGTPNVMELRRGENYRRYLAYEGLDEEYDPEYDELYDEPEETYEDEEYEDEAEEEYEDEYSVLVEDLGGRKATVANVLKDNLYLSLEEVMEELEYLPARFHPTSQEEAEHIASLLCELGASAIVEKDT